MIPTPFRYLVVPRLTLLVALLAGCCLGAKPIQADQPATTRVILELEDLGGSHELMADRLADTSVAIAEAVAGAVVERSFDRLFNGLSVQVPGDNPNVIARMAALPGVKRVYREHAYAPALFESVSTINADAIWQSVSGGQSEGGRGIRIAVIDSGIAAQHPALHDDGYSAQLPVGFPKGDTNCTSNKVIAARAYFRPTDPPCSTETSATPGENGSFHGTAMAGIAAGSVVQASYDGITLDDFSGVAPGAYLMNYRIFYPTEVGGDEYAYTTEILAALEDAMDDGADVILNCWTSVATTAVADSAVAVALASAMADGCVVVAPAGNVGPGVASASLLPGGIEDVLTVGAVQKARIVAADTLDVVSPEPVPDTVTGIQFGRASYGADIETLGADQLVAPVPAATIEAAGYACEPLDGVDMAGKMAVALRGECSFITKTLHVQNAGATGLIVVNTENDHDGLGCYGESCAQATIPSVMVGYEDGVALLAQIADEPASMFAFVTESRIVSERAGVVWDSSARGPAFMRCAKPDVVAPGVDILAPIYPSSEGEAMGLVSGTSAAAAHMAGAGALLLQQHPGWGHDEVKAALVGSATTDILSSADVNTVGAGLPDVAAADAAPILVMPAVLSVPILAEGGTTTLTTILQDTGAGTGNRVYQVTAVVDEGLDLAYPGVITLGSGDNVTLEFDVTALAGAPSGSSQATLTLANAETRIDVPIWVNVQPQPVVADVLVIDNDFSEFWGYRHYEPWITDALDALDISYMTINPDLVYDEPNSITMTLESLLAYDAVIWFTGDNQYPDGYYEPETPLTVADQQLMAAYLDAGGRMLAMGQNLCSASDVNADPDTTWGRAPFYHGYLGAHWIKDELYGAGTYPPSSGPAVVGVPDSFLSGVQLSLAQGGDGAANQASVDEIAPGGSRSGDDDELTQAVLVAVDGAPDENGYVGVAKNDEPSLDDPTVHVPYRALYYSFGFEGINNIWSMTSRTELLDASLNWLLDEVFVSMAPITDSVNVLTTISCEASTTHADGDMSYRWRVGEGDDGWETISTEPSISAIFYENGTVPVAVQVTDALGHSAVASSEVHIVEGGNCTLVVDSPGARPGEKIVYTIEVRNTAPRSVEASFEMMQPAWTTYVSSTGGTWSAGTLGWSGTLGPESVQTLQLTVQVLSSAPAGTEIEGTGSFAVGGRAFQLSATTRVGSLAMLPLVSKQ